MRSPAIGIAVVVAVLAIASQLFIPGYVEGRVAERLEKGGGSAKVSVSAFPALPLLWKHGGTLDVEGRGLRVDLEDRDRDPLGALKGFSRVHIRLEDLSADPVTVRTFALRREEKGSPYYLRMDASTTPRQFAEAVGARAGGALGGLIGSFATGMFPNGGNSEIPVEVEGELQRRAGGRLDVDDVSASVGGLPAGPFAEIVVQAVLRRL